jgi:hypothetical protein
MGHAGAVIINLAGDGGGLSSTGLVMQAWRDG